MKNKTDDLLETTQNHLKGAPFYTVGEEITNAITHGIGAGLAIAGLVILLVFSGGDPVKIVSSCLYGAGMIFLFLMSCLYHSLTHPVAKKVFRVFDHTTIFLLIAGTYTPYTLVALRGWVGYTIFGVVWASCLLGIVLNAVSLERFKNFSMICYLASGWCIILAIYPMMQSMELGGLLLLFGGGICYTVGVLFYKLKHIQFMHGIWHLLVLAGAVMHYFSILLYVIRPAG